MANKIPVLWVDVETNLFWVQKENGLEEVPRQIQDKFNRIIRVVRVVPA